MKCPVCKADVLEPILLQDDLPARTCPQCSGIWLRFNDYLAWQHGRGADLEEMPSDKPFDPKWETRELKLCPDCGHILARYKTFPDVNYYLDRCRNCNGIWFDKNEWDALAERNLHVRLNEFFTHPWQEKLHQQETAHHMEKIYLEKFGENDYEHAKKVRQWLKGHPRRNMLIAFLQADDPYKI
jgi:Zn-finger nucleic acid-binding protein